MLQGVTPNVVPGFACRYPVYVGLGPSFAFGEMGIDADIDVVVQRVAARVGIVNPLDGMIWLSTSCSMEYDR